MDAFITLLQWLIPSGSIGAVLVWLTSRTFRQTRENKEVHDTYKAMYEDVQTTLHTLQNENTNMQLALARLRHLVVRTATCRYFLHCPLRTELQTSGIGAIDTRARTKPRAKGGEHHPRDTHLADTDHTTGHTPDDNLFDEPP